MISICHRNYDFTCGQEATTESMMKATTYATIKASTARIEVNVNVDTRLNVFNCAKFY